METDLPKRVSTNIETQVVGIIYQNRTIKYFIKETILMGEYQVVGDSEREEELVGC